MKIYISMLICFFTRRGKKPELGSGYFALLEEVLFIFYILVLINVPGLSCCCVVCCFGEDLCLFYVFYGKNC